MMLMCLLISALAIANGYPQYTQSSEDQIAAATDQHDDDSDMYMEAIEHAPSTSVVQPGGSDSDGYVGDSQQFYPSFAPFHNQPLGHSRPVYQPEAAYSHRPTAYQQHVGFDSTARFSGYKGENANTGSADTHGILGSGNFGVIRGGTFYGDNDDADSFDQYNYYNGHGRPSFYFGGNPRPRQYQQFENFRDFADINVPTNPAYSQYVVVYANKNGSKPTVGVHSNKPKNIMEHLALIDLETQHGSTTPVPEKISKAKRKLAKVPKEKKPWTKKGKTSKDAKTQIPKENPTTTTTISPDLYEPLLALS
ncbi:uncharacterized protein [Atheta coriaria]|uniref:uncharacterized protein n=1 Tax=Dalotia coriaria TaxID=877792 RepID=UPI0031F3C99B